MFFLAIIIVTASFAQSDEKNKTNFFPHMKDISPQLHLALSNDSRVYKLSSVTDMMNETRRYVIFNIDLINYHYRMNQRVLVCYLTSFTYRSALWDIFRYFHIRDLYVSNLEYEIGYLTQEVIYHYQVILEIYQMVYKRYVLHPTRNFGPVGYMFFMYTNLLEKSKIIIHLCSMMHELEEKHRKTKSKGVFAEEDVAGGPGGYGGSGGSGGSGGGDNIPKPDMTKVDQEKIAYQRWLDQRAREEKKRQKEQKEYQKQVKKFKMTTRRKKKVKKSAWPLDYGWSIEDW